MQTKVSYCPECGSIWVPGRSKCECGFKLSEETGVGEGKEPLTCHYEGCSNTNDLEPLGFAHSGRHYYCATHRNNFFESSDGVFKEVQKRARGFKDEAKVLNLSGHDYFVYYLATKSNNLSFIKAAKAMMDKCEV